MNVKKVDNINFGARIVINKKGFKNLTKDLSDIGRIGLNTTESASTNLCASSTPWALKKPVPDKDGYVYPTKELADDVEKRLHDIKNRNIKTIETESPKALSAQTAGTGSLLTGISSYIGSVAAGIDTLLYHADLPKSAVESAKNTEFINVIHNGMAKCNQEPVDRVIGSSVIASIGFATQIQGLKLFKKADKIIEANGRKIPS